MYISSHLLLRAIEELRRVHPFHGITFLVCKGNNLPVGTPVEFAMDRLTREHMDIHHKLASNSAYYFQPFGSSSRPPWLKHDYPSSGLQAINTQTFKSAFIHDKGSKTWAWDRNYLSVLEERLRDRTGRIPAWALAVWLYRSVEWGKGDDLEVAISRLIQDYCITDDESQRLFSTLIPKDISQTEIFADTVLDWDDFKHNFKPPPDATPERGGMLAFLHVHGAGPATDMVLKPASRLTIITGDNGLGKSFLMDCAWWALTGTWTAHPALPLADADTVYIEFGIRGSADFEDKLEVPYDRTRLCWPSSTEGRTTISGLIIYARADGSFAVWDPIRSARNDIAGKGSVTLSGEQVWDGQGGIIEGLVRDWVKWQNAPTKYPFEMLTNVLRRLSPPDLGELLAGETIRIPNDPREIPTVVHKYGVTPVLYASAGLKRILALSYLMVWAWSEHLIAASLAGRPPENRMVILVDEMEAHLHPKWQRVVLPALCSINTYLQTDNADLQTELALQLILATHSPLVVASAEPIFRSADDALVHLDILESGEISIDEIPFTKYGEVSSWLTSPVFQLKQARSQEAEKAIEEAKFLQMGENPTKVAVEQISNRLIEYLPSNDSFWPRWIAFAERYGVVL